MDEHTKTETIVGLFVLTGATALVFLAASIGGLELVPVRHYRIDARFATIGTLKQGAPVKVAGVRVGRVQEIALDAYAAKVCLEIQEHVGLPEGTVASIRNEGLLGESYVLLTPGASEALLVDGDRIIDTEPAIDVIDLISKYAFERELQ